MRENEHGKCFGYEQCEGASGWSACSAAEPAPEICDGLDNDCDGAVDEDQSPVACERSNDYGACPGVETCAGVAGFICDAPAPELERCDDLDNDCDGVTDDGFELKLQPCDSGDDDFCAYGFWVCAEDGATLVCADDLAQVEICNDHDDDCDGQTDEDWAIKGQPCDAEDQDLCPLGVYVCGPGGDDVVCFEETHNVEVCDGKDNDCNGTTDDGFPDLDGNGEADCIDDDQDGDGDPNQTDCAPLDPAVFHEQVEACNQIDDDCDAQTDEGFPNTDGDALADCLDLDDDNDGIADEVDNCPLTANPNQLDTDLDKDGDACDDDDDDDTVGDDDDNCPKDANTDQADGDGDGAGDACDQDDDDDGDPDDFDCLPLNPDVHHGAVDVCNGLDDNCDLLVDEGFADTDGDLLKDCVDPDDDDDGDPDDTDCRALNPLVNHQALEVCNGIDDDCDGLIDEGFEDLDGNGQPDCLDQDDDGDGDPDETDCQPMNAAISHLALEICDGLDNNCDTQIDEGFADADADSVKDCTDGDDDNDGDPDDSDCRPFDASVHGQAFEDCDGIDNDCDALIDEGFENSDADAMADCVDPDDDDDGVPDEQDNCPLAANTGQANTDSDLLGDACDQDDDNDGDPDDSDCAPLNMLIHSSQAELCDGFDNNCNGLIDEGHADFDQDGVMDCVDDDDDNDGALDEDDCKPKNATISPLEVDVCNAVDDNCDGQVDEGFPDFDSDLQKDCVDDDDDNDNDPDATDCAPYDGAVSHNAAESCNGVDDDCDSQVDEGFDDSNGDGQADCVDTDDDGDGVLDPQDNCPLTANPSQANSDGDMLGDACDDDDDNDGVGDAQDNCPFAVNQDQADSDGDLSGDACDADDDNDGSPDGADCQPLNAAVSPLKLELCNGLDDNCDASVDEGYTDFDADGVKDCVDDDDDNDNDPDDTDCAPYNAAVNGSASELCNGMDDNCNNQIDEGFVDSDADGVRDCMDSDDDDDGDPDVTDCQDTNASVFHGQAEACDGLDNNCNALIDEGFLDSDGDDLADCEDTDDDNDGDPDASDCDDLNAAVNHGATEVCNGIDDDCSGEVDEGFPDGNGNGVPDCAEADGDQDGDPDSSDCAPQDPAVFHGATEQCNGVDDNCDGSADEGFGDYDVDGVADCVDGDDDGDGDDDVSDCAPLNAAIHHGAAETCDGVDQDCDAQTDEGFSDSDGDGFRDCVDTDDDGDGVGDDADNCPLAANQDQLDTDHDSAGDVCDDDDDDDTIPDLSDNCDTVVNPGQADHDGDGAGDVCDKDDDNDGDPDVTDCADFDAAVHHGAAELCNGADDNCVLGVDEGFVDTDGDTLADCVDTDDDNDNVLDDGDGGGVVGDAPCAGGATMGCDDNCRLSANAGQADLDGDASGDACDDDIDGDGEGNDTDCNDYNAGVHHGVTEVCNGIDDDCDNDVDEGEMTAPAGTLYYKDNDGDTYADTGDGKRYCQETGKYNVTPAGYHDCCDADNNVRPGQATYYTAAGACGGFDYNCDGGQEPHWPAGGTCACNRWFWGFCTGCGGTSGWSGGVPGCGGAGQYITACTYNLGSCGVTQETRTQECR